MEEKKLIPGIVPLDDKPTVEEKKKYTRGIVFEAPTKHFEEKAYLMLYYIRDEEDDVMHQVFNICVGRTEAIGDIKSKLETGIDIDIHKSRVMTETKQTETKTGDLRYYMIPLSECISVYSFCKSVEDYYGLEYFDIEQYNEGIEPDEETNPIPQAIMPSKEEEEYRKLLSMALEDKPRFGVQQLVEGSNV